MIEPSKFELFAGIANIPSDVRRKKVGQFLEAVDLVEFGKKLFLSSIVLCFPEGTVTRIALAVLVTGSLLVLTVWHQPYKVPVANHVNFAVSCALLACERQT